MRKAISTTKRGYMKKIVVTLVVATLLSATATVPAFADGWGGHGHGRGGGVDPFWPITWPIAAVLAIPAAIVGTVAHVAVPEPSGYGYATPPVPVYSRPATYYAPEPYYEPRVYVAPRGYYHDRGYRSYRGGW
jgi:hypothetical protein